jgi:hypothetical protein
LKVVWPTIGATRAGRLVGQLCAVKLGIGPYLTLGKLLALVTIPVTLCIFFWQLLPVVCRRYWLTNRRIVIQKGLGRLVEESAIGLDQFDAVEIEVLPGQDWLRSGELLFLSGGNERLRLSGVPRPEVFRQGCLKARTALLSVGEVLRQQAAAAAVAASP